MKKLQLLIIVLFSIWGMTLHAQNFTITTCSADSITHWLNTNNVPAVGIGIIENGQIKSIKVYGEIKKDVHAPVNTFWNVASLTKPVTAMVVLSLVNKGEWDLDEPVSRYWTDPDIKDNPWAGKLTTRILLSHQSGFLNWRQGEPSKKLNFHFEPGTRMGYSGEGYEYVRRALENKFGKSLQQIAAEELFTPVGMKETHYGWDNSLDSNRFAEAHNSKGARYPYQKTKAIIAADWLVTTISDYCRFGLFVINGGGLSNNLYNEMSAIQVNFDTVATHRSTGMGLGWQVIKNLPNGEFALTHSGSDNGAKTVVLLLPKSKRGIVIFTNGENGNNVKNNILKASLPDLKPELAKYMGEFR